MANNCLLDKTGASIFHEDIQDNNEMICFGYVQGVWNITYAVRHSIYQPYW